MSDYQDALQDLVKSTLSTKEQFEKVIALGRVAGYPDKQIAKDIKEVFAGKLEDRTIRDYLPAELKNQKMVRNKPKLVKIAAVTAANVPAEPEINESRKAEEEDRSIERMPDYPEAYTAESLATKPAPEVVIIHATKEEVKENFAHFFMANRNNIGAYIFIKGGKLDKILADNEYKVEATA